MEVHPLVIQGLVALPIIVGLIVFILFHAERRGLHVVVAGMMATLIPWLLGLVLRSASQDPRLQDLGLDLEHITPAWMSPFFVITMGYFARLRIFERSWAASAVLLSGAPIMTAMYLTDPVHHLYFADRAAALAQRTPSEFAGPLFWASQIYFISMDAVGLVFLGLAVARGRTPQERRRALTLVAAVLVPIVAHVAYVAEWLPVDYSLTPIALSVTAGLFVHGVNRNGIFDAQPLIRSDVIDHLSEGLILTSLHDEVVDLNEGASRLLGCNREDGIGSDLASLLESLMPAEKARDFAGRLAALAPDAPGINIEIRTPGDRVLELNAGAVRARGTLPAGRFVMLRDRSEQRRTESLLRERQKLESVGILAAGVAHEVNNPLSYVRANLVHAQGLVEEFAKGQLSPPGEEEDEWRELPDILRESLEGISRIEAVVEGMLRFSRVSDDRPESIDINTVVEDALRLSDLHRTHGVAVAAELGPELPMVEGSANRLVQALLNLLLNGKQALAGRDNARLVAETSLEGNEVIVRVRDNGPGVPEELRGKIFDPFFTTQDPNEGTGLGLSITFDIVREHRGTLELENRDEGACFAVHLPVAMPA